MAVPLVKMVGLWLGLVVGLPVTLFVLGLSTAFASGDVLRAIVVAVVLGGIGLALIAPLVPLASIHLRGLPTLVVEPDALTFHQPAVLRRPLRIQRSDVHSVYVDFRPDIHGHNSVLLPNLSLLHVRPNLLVVFHLPLALGRDVRHGMGTFNTLMQTTAPTRITYARGVVAQVQDVELAGRALAGWPTTSPVPADVLDWIRGR